MTDRTANDDFGNWKAERNKGLALLDMEYARRAFPNVDEGVLLIAMHKARYECTDIAPALRLESRKWLAERNYKRFGQMPLLPEGELPE